MKKNQRKLICLSFIVLCFQPLKTIFAENSKIPHNINTIDFNSAPKTRDWNTVMHSPLKRVWAAKGLPMKKGKVQLSKMTWEWRIGLVRLCEGDNTAVCRRILVEALTDSAMVVRTQAAMTFAHRYKDTKDGKALEILKHAFRNPANTRAGKPMFVQNRILFAIAEIGGLDAKLLGHELSRNDKALRSYWSKLQKNL